MSHVVSFTPEGGPRDFAVAVPRSPASSHRARDVILGSDWSKANFALVICGTFAAGVGLTFLLWFLVHLIRRRQRRRDLISRNETRRSPSTQSSIVGGFERVELGRLPPYTTQDETRGHMDSAEPASPGWFGAPRPCDFDPMQAQHALRETSLPRRFSEDLVKMEEVPIKLRFPVRRSPASTGGSPREEFDETPREDFIGSEETLESRIAKTQRNIRAARRRLWKAQDLYDRAQGDTNPLRHLTIGRLESLNEARETLDRLQTALHILETLRDEREAIGRAS